MYIENGKKFVFAKVLFDVNEEIHHLVKSNIVMCPEERKQDAYDLIFHIDVWRTIWNVMPTTMGTMRTIRIINY